MAHALTRRSRGLRLLRSGLFAVVLALALAGQSGAQREAATVPCPVSAAELSAIVGKTLQRVNLSGGAADASAQCAFSVVAKGRFLSPQVYLMVDKGGAADLKALHAYYVQARSKLATKPRVALRSDLGVGAFTLSATTVPVTTAYFLVGKNGLATLTVDLADAPAAKQGQGTADRILALFADRIA